jgi:hypothetical protein
MASLALSELIPLVRAMADDNDVYLQEYTDEELITNLRIGIMLMEAAWNNGYAVELASGTELVVYDNEIASTTDAMPTTAIQGGSIVIHSSK